MWYKNNFPSRLTKVFLINHKETKILWARKYSTHLKLLLRNGLILDNYLYLTSGRITSFVFLQNIHVSMNLGIKKNFFINITPHPFMNKVRIKLTPRKYGSNEYMKEVLHAMNEKRNIIRDAFKKEGNVRVDFIRLIGEREAAGVNVRLASLIERVPITKKLLESFLILLEILKERLGAEYLQVIPKEYINAWEI